MATLGFINLSVPEIAAIVFVGLIVFGGKLPDVARNLGQTLREFKAGMNDRSEPGDGDDEAKRRQAKSEEEKKL
ncbi:MAG: twin-arginine translocase TatA/TatE family subunit [Planctomycetes bacterium]|nr:twin-arginine translocase TatA/TatE family subunit [Planctomycetota bacterium]